MSARSLLIASAFAATTLAQTTVTSLYLYGFEGNDLVASVVSAAPEATAYFINCAEGTDSNDCGFGQGVTFTEGPSTLAIHYTEDGAISVDATCQVASNTASCVETDAGTEANDPGTSTVVLSDLSSSLSPVTITAGLDLLSSGGNATTTGSSGTAASTAEPSSSAESGASKTSGATAKTSGTASSTSGSSSATVTSGADRTGLNVAAAAGIAGFVGMAMAI